MTVQAAIDRAIERLRTERTTRDKGPSDADASIATQRADPPTLARSDMTLLAALANAAGRMRSELGIPDTQPRDPNADTSGAMIAAGTICPACDAPVLPGDVFCEVCGESATVDGSSPLRHQTAKGISWQRDPQVGHWCCDDHSAPSCVRCLVAEAGNVVEQPPLRADVNISVQADGRPALFGPIAKAPAKARLCLRLTPPRCSTDGWQLEAVVQSIDDPTLIVVAADIWENSQQAMAANGLDVAAVSVLTHSLSRAQEILPLVNCISPGTPTILLTSAEVVLVLRAAAALDQAGVGLVAPDIQRRRSTRVRLQAREDEEGSGLFKVKSLATFDWRVALGEEELSMDEFHVLVAQKSAIVQHQGRWIEVDPTSLAAKP
jgi:hypothetical protein